MTDTLSLIKDKETENFEIDKRQDTDRDLVLLVWGGLKGISEQFKNVEMPGTVSVAMNKAGVYADAFISVLSSLTRQCVIEGEITETQKNLTEDFLDSLIYSINQSLIARRVGSLGLLLAQHMSIRRGVGAKLNFDEDGKPEYTPCDMRWCPFQEDGKGGFEWVANHTRQTGSFFKARFSDWEGANIDLIPDGSRVLDMYDFENGKVNEIWIDKKKIAEQGNPFGFPRYVITEPMTGYYLYDEGSSKWRAESILALNRNLYPEWNRLSSIVQTGAIDYIKPPYVHEKDNPTKPGIGYPGIPGEVTDIEKGEKIYPLLKPDLTQVFMTALTNLSQALQQGGISDAELGDVSINQTAIWITSQESIRRRRMNPRIDCISQYYTQLSSLALKEFKMLEFTGTPRFGKGGKGKEFSPDSLPDPGDITIEYRLMYDNPVLNMARRAEAVAMKGVLSDYDILKDVMMHKDPDGGMDRMRRQQAEQASPVAFWLNTAHRLIDVADKTIGEDKEQIYREAKVAADTMVNTMLNQGNPEQSTANPVQQKGNSQALLALPGIMGGQKQ